VPDDAVRLGVASRLADVRTRVRDAALAAGRDPASVRLLLATKTQPLDVVRVAVQAGGTLLGENRVQELVAKAPGLVDLAPEVHLIGHLQSNKVAQAVLWASCVQSVDTLEIARRISDRSGSAGRVLDVLIQVNVSGEQTKYGVPPEAAADLADAVASLAGVRLRGFMTIGARSADAQVVRAGYAWLRDVRDAVVGSGAPGTLAATELSMGMSGDLELAVAEGATIVRIGTAVFGSRPV
jgi:pyridoxal phosphate enzyme (YggS family)